jgi:beta-catenin-like protein 1
VYNTLAIIENIVSVKPEISVALCARTHIFTFLIERLSAETFDSNKLYSSEIFCILLQADFANVKRVMEEGAVRGMDIIDALLQILFHYRKKEDLLSDEEECVHNLFDSMVTFSHTTYIIKILC